MKIKNKNIYSLDNLFDKMDDQITVKSSSRIVNRGYIKTKGIFSQSMIVDNILFPLNTEGTIIKIWIKKNEILSWGKIFIIDKYIWKEKNIKKKEIFYLRHIMTISSQYYLKKNQILQNKSAEFVKVCFNKNSQKLIFEELEDIYLHSFL